MDLSAPIEEVKGVGPKKAAALKRVNLLTVGDLVYCLPRVYENYQTTTKIEDLRPGKVVIRGKISDLHIIRTSRKRLTITQGVIRDESGAVRTLWFKMGFKFKS